MDGARNASAQARLDASWEALDRAVGELRRYKPHSPEGDQLLEFLFGRDVLHQPQSEAIDKTADLAQLERTIELRDPIALATWTDTHLDRDDRRWLDRAGSRAGLGRAIDDGRRTSFINKSDEERDRAKDRLAQYGYPQ